MNCKLKDALNRKIILDVFKEKLPMPQRTFLCFTENKEDSFRTQTGCWTSLQTKR